MTNTIKSERNRIYTIDSEAEIWEIKNPKKLLKFYKWIRRHKIMPGDIIPRKILKRYYKLKNK